MIPYSQNPKPVRVGYWFIQRQEVNWQIPPGQEGHITKPFVREVRFDKPEVCYEGLFHGFGVEGDFSEGGEFCICALVEKPDGTFDTPSVNTIQLIK